MRLYMVNGAHWWAVVRATDPSDAIRVSRWPSGPTAEIGWEEVGVEEHEVRAIDLTTDGPAEILDSGTS